MSSIYFILLISLAIVGSTAGIHLKRSLRRKRLRAKPFPEEWRTILERNVPLYQRLPDAYKKELHRRIHVFLAEKSFKGVEGLQITDEIRVTIAAQACILVLNRKEEYYPRLCSIIVYPGAYQARRSTLFESESHGEKRQTLLGESWSVGTVVLAWDHITRGARDIEDGQNVVFHEFAHQLDQEDSSSDGAPILDRRSNYISWARVLGKEYKKLQQDMVANKMTLLDQYGATDEAEFFAVATECFFEKPIQMKKKHPKLYKELKNFYKQDPIQYFVVKNI